LVSAKQHCVGGSLLLVNWIRNELGINSTVAIGNATYTPAAHSKDEILQNYIYRFVLDTFNIPVNGMVKNELPYIYWIPKHHKNPYQKIHSWIQQMLHETFIPGPHQNINSCEGETSNVLCHYICQKWRS
jgi:hypothetical protein